MMELRFKPKAVRVIPICGLSGENVSEINTTCALRSWYDGPTLITALDTFRQPVRLTQAPMRAIVTSLVDDFMTQFQSVKGLEVNLKVIQGRLRLNRSIKLSSLSFAGLIKHIRRSDGSNVNSLIAGENGIVTITRL